MLDLAENVQKSYEGEIWPPVLKAVEECVLYGIVKPFLDRFDFEVDPLFYPFKNALPLHLCQKFLKQVRESWGYDVNVRAPGSPFYPVSFPEVECEDGPFQTFFKAECKDLVGKINNMAKEHGEFYVFDEIKKAVMVSGGRRMLITFTVKEVLSNKLEGVRVCFRDGCIIQWSFIGEGQYEDEDEDKVIYFLPAYWIGKSDWTYATNDLSYPLCK